MTARRRVARAAGAILLAITPTACSGVAGSGAAAPPPPAAAVAVIREAARPITGAATDYDSLLTLIGDARVVLLGEATHGTHEFYRERARITQRLIAERGFTAVAIEGNWPEAYRVDRYVRGLGTDASAEQALAGFTRFPRWMWRNTDVRDLVRWLRAHNDARPPAERVGFYGLDVYALYTAMDEVLRYLATGDRARLDRARAAYACFEPHRDDEQRYGAWTRGGGSCEAQARAVLGELQQLAGPPPADAASAEALFAALRNAQSVVNAEAYFRTAYLGVGSTWNLRDEAMAATVGAIAAHLESVTGRPAKIVVWAHNTHAGDARVTEPGTLGELNIGQLMRQRHGDDAVLVGFHTYTGRVYAADAWGEPGGVEAVRNALPESYSALFHATGVPQFWIPLRGGGAAAALLAEPRLERAIGVVYLPRTERQSHYFSARLAQQFDAAVFIDRTTAVTPLP